MLYFGNPCSDLIIDAMSVGLLGMIDTPLQGKKKRVAQAHAEEVLWCADNGAFSNRFSEEGFWQFLEKKSEFRGTCAFAVAPDVVGNAGATLARSLPALPRIREMGFSPAFVAQDGIENIDVPWDLFDTLFIGGTDDFKLGPTARRYAREAKQQGKHLHMGRVNSLKRLSYAKSIGCDTTDGTYLVFGPDANLRTLLRWHVELQKQPRKF